MITSGRIRRAIRPRIVEAPPTTWYFILIISSYSLEAGSRPAIADVSAG
jgi:hypothetical protein